MGPARPPAACCSRGPAAPAAPRPDTEAAPRSARHSRSAAQSAGGTRRLSCGRRSAAAVGGRRSPSRCDEAVPRRARSRRGPRGQGEKEEALWPPCRPRPAGPRARQPARPAQAAPRHRARPTVRPRAARPAGAAAAGRRRGEARSRFPPPRRAHRARPGPDAAPRRLSPPAAPTHRAGGAARARPRAGTYLGAGPRGA